MRTHSKLIVMGLAGIALASTPAAAAQVSPAAAAGPIVQVRAIEPQTFRAPAEVQTQTLDRGGYSVAYEPKISQPVAPAPVSSGFGQRTCPGDGPCTTDHQGIDLAAGEGSPVKSMASGVVLVATPDDGNHGHHVMVKHHINGETFVTSYSHLSAIHVREGQRVQRGDLVGAVGDTGRSYGAHLHLEIHLPGHGPVNPSAWLASHDVQPFPG